MSGYYELKAFAWPSWEESTEVAHIIEDQANEVIISSERGKKIFIAGKWGEFDYIEESTLINIFISLSLTHPSHVIRVIHEMQDVWIPYEIAYFFYRGQTYAVSREPFDPKFDIRELHKIKEA